MSVLRVFNRSLIGLVAGVLTGAVLGILVGSGIATADYIANPPQGEDFGFSFTAAAFSVIGAIAGTWTGLATGMINRRWGGIVVGAIVGFLSGFTWYAPTSWTPSAALSLAIPGSLIGAVTGIVVFQVIAPVGNKH
jgi:hypothetical protein